MRDLLNLLENIISEAGLTPAELAKHGGAYLTKLVQVAQAGPVTLTPDAATKLGQQQVTLTPETVAALKKAQTGTPLPPNPMFVLDNGSQIKGSWGAIQKGAEYTGVEQKKAYNTGHLAELFMGLSVTAKFFNLGNPITVQQVVDMFTFAQVDSHTNPKTGKLTSNIVFTISRNIDYPANIKGNPDHLTFRGVIPGVSAEAFMQQVKSKQFSNDIQAVLGSAVRYVNEAPSVKSSIRMTQQDKGTNQINVVSDGTSDAKMTKADIVLSVDGKKINLFSLKTYSTDTLGQISGVGFDQVSRWFMTSFGIDLSKYKQQIEGAKTPEEGFRMLLRLYDITFPELKAVIDNQSPGKEAAIVKQLAKAANYHARGEAGEDVEIVKLDDKIKDGNYKILKFSDNLVDAMSKLDLDVTMNKGENNRTIQIWAKPDPNVPVKKGANKLCQFRTQKMGPAYRNYFESGPMLEKLTTVDTNTVKEEFGSGSSTEETPLQVKHGIIPSSKPQVDNIAIYGRKFKR